MNCNGPKFNIFICLCFLLSTALGFATARADSQNVELVGRFEMGGTEAVAAVGDVAYIGAGYWLKVVDFSAPSSPVVLGEIAAPSEITGVAISGSYACVTGYDGLSVFDVSAPSVPVEVGFYQFQEFAPQLTTSGVYAFIAGRNTGLRIINISTPSTPVEVGSYDTEGSPRHVAVLENYAYVAAYDGGVRVIDVSTPASPVEVGSYIPAGAVWCVAASGNYVFTNNYVAGNDELLVLDVTTPSTPVEVGSYSVTGWGNGLTIAGNYAYSTVEGHGLLIVDVSTPSSPVEIGSYETPEGGNLSVSGTNVYVCAGGNGLRVIDASIPTSPVEVASIEPDAAGAVYDVAVSGDFAYAADASNGLRVVDVSNPSNPTQIGFYELGPNTQIQSVTLMGNYAFVPEWTVEFPTSHGGIRVLDISIPSNPTSVGFYDLTASASGLTIEGTYGYLAAGKAGLRILYLGTPSSPLELGAYDIGDVRENASDVAVSGSNAYIADGELGLRVIDVSTPSAPTEIGFYWGSSCGSVEITGDYAYISGGALRVLDISTPSSPVEIGSYGTRGGSITLVGDLVYMAASYDGLRVIDVSDPSNPVEKGYFAGGNMALDVTVYNGDAYVSEWTDGFYIARYSPDVPVALQALDAAADGALVRISWSVSDESGLRGYRIYRDERTALDQALIPADGRGRYSCVDDKTEPNTGYEYTLVAVEKDGSERILGTTSARSGGPAALALDQNVPNPFNPSTSITFELPERAVVDLSIYDVEGRFVRTLAHGIESAGSKTCRWDGCDNNGSPVASGVYVYKLRAGKQTLSRKMTLLR